MILITRCCQHVIAIVSVTSNSKTLLCLTYSDSPYHISLDATMAYSCNRSH